MRWFSTVKEARINPQRMYELLRIIHAACVVSGGLLNARNLQREIEVVCRPKKPSRRSVPSAGPGDVLIRECRGYAD